MRGRSDTGSPPDRKEPQRVPVVPRERARVHPMNEVTVRDARPEDLPRLLELYRQLDPNADNTPPDEWQTLRPIVESITADPRQHLLVAEADGRIIGSLTLVVVLNLTHGGRPWAEVENVIVDEETRQTGAGQLLMDRAEAIAKETGATSSSYRAASPVNPPTVSTSASATRPPRAPSAVTSTTDDSAPAISLNARTQAYSPSGQDPRA